MVRESVLVRLLGVLRRIGLVVLLPVVIAILVMPTMIPVRLENDLGWRVGVDLLIPRMLVTGTENKGGGGGGQEDE